MLGICDLLEQEKRYTVHEFQRDSLQIIDKLLGNKKLPVLVGGTMYYVESVLFDHLVPSRNINESESESEVEDKWDRDGMKEKSNEELFEELKQLDPDSAFRLHPNDRRKIIRAIEVCRRTGKKLSDYYEEQHGEKKTADDKFSGLPRYENSLMIWLDCDQTILNERLDTRIDAMIEEGLIKEFDDFFNEFKKKQWKDPFHNGVLQSIGLKEFLPYMDIVVDERESEQGQKTCKQSVEAMKTKTRRYARKQLTWIRNRFLKRRGSDCPPVFRLDVSDFVKFANSGDRPAMEQQWNKIMSSAMAIAEHVVSRGVSNESLSLLKQKTGLSEAVYEGNNEKDKVIHEQCLVCKNKPVFVRQSQWQQHLDSWRHRKSVGRMKKMKKNESNAT